MAFEIRILRCKENQEFAKRNEKIGDYIDTITFKDKINI
jgi:hypothetical protein